MEEYTIAMLLPRENCNQVSGNYKCISCIRKSSIYFFASFLHRVFFLNLKVPQVVRRCYSPALMEHILRADILFTIGEFRNTTVTVMSSWKCLLIPLPIFCRSKYLISLFRAATWSAAFISLLAIPCKYQLVIPWQKYIIF